MNFYLKLYGCLFCLFPTKQRIALVAHCEKNSPTLKLFMFLVFLQGKGNIYCAWHYIYHQALFSYEKYVIRKINPNSYVFLFDNMTREYF